MTHLTPPIEQVLLIDENAEDGLFFQRALGEAAPHARFRWARNAGQAREILETFTPDIIFLESDAAPGLPPAPLETLMAPTVFRSVPVVLHSHGRNATAMALAYSLGADIHFRKPANYPVLVMGLRKVLDLDWAGAGAAPLHLYGDLPLSTPRVA
jgi:PleD family two-component response regulator